MQLNKLLFIILILGSRLSQSQDSIPIYEIQGKLEGLYHPYKKTYQFELIIPHKNKDERLSYNCSKFNDGLGVVIKEHTYLKSIYNNFSEVQEEEWFTERKMGVIDTLGRIIIPFDYKNLQLAVLDSNYCLFQTFENDSLVVLDTLNRIVFKLPNASNNRQTYVLAKKQDKKIKNSDHIYISYNDQFFLYDLKNNKIVLPSSSINEKSSLKKEEYFVLKKTANYALYINTPSSLDFDDLSYNPSAFSLYGSNINYIVYDLNNNSFSKPYKIAAAYNDSLVYMSDSTHSWLTKDIVNPTNIFDYESVDVFNEYSYNLGYKREGMKMNNSFLDFLIVKKKNEFGVVKLDGTVLIPLIYDNIFRIDTKHFWVKKNNFWAIISLKNELLTDFDFIDIDKMNKVNFDNFMYYTQLNPYVIGKSFHRYTMAHDSDIDYLANLGGVMKRYENTHNYFSVFNYEFDTESHSLFGKKKDGYHLITFTDSSLLLSESSFDNIFIINHYATGFQKGDKFGFDQNDINHDRILIDLQMGVYAFYGSYSHRIEISSNLFVNNGVLYGYQIYKDNKKYKIGKYFPRFYP